MASRLSPFDYINSINNKTEVETLDDYNAFMVNRGLSQYIDTVMLANEMNRYHKLDNDIQYNFLYSAVRKKKRFTKWNKYNAEHGIDAIKEYYGYNEDKAREAIKLLSESQIEKIINILSKGGFKK